MTRIALAALAVALLASPAALAQPGVTDFGGDPSRRPLPQVRVDGTVFPGPVVLSGGVASQNEIAKFEAMWMSEDAQKGERYWACHHVYTRYDAGVWGTHEYMGALAQMYALTRNPAYIAQLDAIATCILKFRDDRHQGPERCDPPEPCEFHDRRPSVAEARELRPRPLDQIRNRQSLPAWGGRSINSANLYRVEEVVSSLYAYWLGRVARMVLEDGTLPAPYTARAVDYANASVETIAFFLTQFETRDDGPYHQGFLVAHPNLKNRWTKADCTRALNQTIAAASPPPTPEGIARFKKQRDNCQRTVELDLAGKPMSQNENGAFAMAMIEVTRALGTDAYRQHSGASPTAYFWRGSFPLFVSRIQRYFARDLTRYGTAPNDWYAWHHSEHTSRWEDSSHASLSMQYVLVLARDIVALRAATAQAEPIALAPEDLPRFARTFVRMNERPDMAVDVRSQTPTSIDNNLLCYAWLDLSAVDYRVYERCRDRVLRLVGGEQVSLSMPNHAALLANGRPH